MIEIIITTGSGIVQVDYKENIVEGRSVNEVFQTFLEKGDDGMPVSLRPGDNIIINKIPAA